MFRRAIEWMSTHELIMGIATGFLCYFLMNLVAFPALTLQIDPYGDKLDLFTERLGLGEAGWLDPAFIFLLPVAGVLIVKRRLSPAAKAFAATILILSIISDIGDSIVTSY